MHRKSLCADDLRLKTIEKYSPFVYRLAFSQMKSKSDADDIHQEVFVRYITRKPDFESEEHAKAWFIRVTTNLCKNWWKTVWRRRIISMAEYEEGEIRQKQGGQHQSGRWSENTQAGPDCRGTFSDADRHLRPYLKDSGGNEIQSDCSVGWQEEINGKRVLFDEHWFLISREELENYELYGMFYITDGSVKGNWEVNFKVE